MRATFAILTDRVMENLVARLAWEVHLRWRTGVGVRRLPPHISLKQPFLIDLDLAVLEEFFTSFAASTAPFDVTAGKFNLWETVLAISIVETPDLRALHDRLNRELPRFFRTSVAGHDGEDYRFHLTVSQGGATPEVYREILDSLAPRNITASFRATEIALFVYDEPEPGRWEYMTHTILPLSSTAK